MSIDSPSSASRHQSYWQKLNASFQDALNGREYQKGPIDTLLVVVAMLSFAVFIAGMLYIRIEELPLHSAGIYLFYLLIALASGLGRKII